MIQRNLVVSEIVVNSTNQDVVDGGKNLNRLKLDVTILGKKNRRMNTCPEAKTRLNTEISVGSDGEDLVDMVQDNNNGSKMDLSLVPNYESTSNYEYSELELS